MSNFRINPVADKELSFQQHLEELRIRLIHSALAVFVGFILGWIFRRDLLYLLKKPLLEALPEEVRHTILLKVIDKFFVDLKVAFIGAVFLAAPYIVLQAWKFISPGLYGHEKRIALPLLLFGGLFFAAGVLFCYLLVLPFGFSFLVEYSSSGSDLIVLGDALPAEAGATDKLQIALREHIGFTASILFAFGIAFETPLVIFLLGWTGIVPPDWFARRRKYALVMVFVFAAVLTPPDPWTQLALGIPLFLLYETGIWATRLFLTFRREKPES